MATPTSQNGFSVDPPRRTIRAGGRTASVRAGDAADILEYVARQFHALVEPLATLNGYRSAAGNAATGTPVDNSNHRSGTAIDVNGARYPYEWSVIKRGGTYRYAMDAAKAKIVRAILEELNATVRWGRDFNPPYRDEMHFEIAPGVTLAQLAPIAKLARKANAVAAGTWHTTRKTNARSGRTGRAIRQPAPFTETPIVGARIWRGAVWAVTPSGNLYRLEHLRRGKVQVPEWYTVTADVLNVRSGPSTSRKTKAQRKRGDHVLITRTVKGDGRTWLVHPKGGHYAAEYMRKGKV